MTADNMTPEEKLLKIIEKPQLEKAPAATPVAASSIAVKKPEGWLGLLRIDADISKYATVQTAKWAMAAVCAILTVFFIINYVTLMGSLNRRFYRLEEEAANPDIDANKASLPEEKFSDILEAARRRNMFTALPIQEGGQGAPAADPTQAISNLKMVGIMWSENPQAMIEDSKENKTYLVGTGEQVGQFKIKAISKNKVILNKDDQEWELR